MSTRQAELTPEGLLGLPDTVMGLGLCRVNTANFIGQSQYGARDERSSLSSVGHRLQGTHPGLKLAEAPAKVKGLGICSREAMGKASCSFSEV